MRVLNDLSLGRVRCTQFFAKSKSTQITVADALTAARNVNIEELNEQYEGLDSVLDLSMSELRGDQRKQLSRAILLCEREGRAAHRAARLNQPRASRDYAKTKAATRMAAVNRWSRALGPLLTENELINRVGSAEVATQMEAAGVIFALPARENTYYPEFQLDLPQPGLGQFHSIVTEHGCVSPWTAASWCITKNADLDEMTPAGWLLAEKDLDRLEDVAYRDAARMAA